jgi:hypothetical protein
VAGFGSVRERIQTMFLRNLLKRQASALLGRALPFGIGAVVGGVGNRMMGLAVIANAKEAFGPMPDTIPGELRAIADTTGPEALRNTQLPVSGPDAGPDTSSDSGPRNGSTPEGGKSWI